MNKLVLSLPIALMLSLPSIVHAHDHHDHRLYDDIARGGEWKEEFRDGPCEVKIESERGEYKREIKCKDGRGAWWRGEWKTEYREGPCRIKEDVKYDEFKEEIKCELRR